MKSNKIKVLTLILAISLAVSMLAGCSGQQAAPEDSAEPAPAESEAPAESAPVEEAPAEEASIYPLVDEKVTLTAYAPIRSENTAVVTEMGDWETIQLAEDITNVHIDFRSVSTDQYSEMCPIMVASGEYSDIIYSLNQGYGGGLTKAYSEEVIIDMADLVHEYAPNYCALLDGIDRGWQRATTEDGNVLALYSLNSDSNQQGIMIRVDWLEEQRLEIPETVDQFVDMLYTFRDAYGVTPMQMSSATQEGLLFTSAYDVPGYQVSIFGSGSYWYQTDGQVRCALVEDGYKEPSPL